MPERGNLSGKQFVLTGTLENMIRDEAKWKITEAEGLFTSSVSAKTDNVLVGPYPAENSPKPKPH